MTHFILFKERFLSDAVFHIAWLSCTTIHVKHTLEFIVIHNTRSSMTQTTHTVQRTLKLCILTVHTITMGKLHW